MACHALEPKEILVLANRNMPESIGLAKYYMKKREIPKENLLKLSTTDRESIPREEYNAHIVIKVREYLKDNNPGNHIRCLVTVYGIPLKISPPELSLVEKAEYEIATQRRNILRDQLNALDESSEEKRESIQKELTEIEKKHEVIQKKDQRAALDSELALVSVEEYQLSGWLPNPYYIGFRNQKLQIPKEKVFWVSRIDGPTPEIVKRIIDDSIEVGKKGLAGTAYFDARWPKPSEAKNVEGYTLYDKSIHKAAKQVLKMNQLKVVIDDQPELFQPGQCPNTALYCGWYSLAKYVEAFKWAKGAIGYHIASAECSTLKKSNSEVWCKRILEEGGGATIGPTSEPYVQAFPLPELFFGMMVNGKLTLIEAYMASTPFLSWQMVLIGDPLYRPFRTGNG